MSIKIIDATEDSPKITLDSEKSVFTIEGNSYPEHAVMIYNPVIEWIEDQINSNASEINGVFYFSILSSASHKVIYDILQKLHNYQKQGGRVQIKWLYHDDDDDMLDIGEDFADSIDFIVQLVPKKYSLDE